MHTGNHTHRNKEGTKSKKKKMREIRNTPMKGKEPDVGTEQGKV